MSALVPLTGYQHFAWCGEHVIETGNCAGEPLRRAPLEDVAVWAVGRSQHDDDDPYRITLVLDGRVGQQTVALELTVEQAAALVDVLQAAAGGITATSARGGQAGRHRDP